jgi:hypothetical protein
MEEAKAQLKEFEEAGMIEPSNSPMPKKDGTQ